MADPLVLPDPRSLRDWVGKKLGTSDWLEMSQRRIDLFAEATGDDQWIHVNPERAARESPFGGTVAHGHLTLSLAPYFFRQIVEVKGVRMVVNPGIEHMRLRSPVRAGDRVRMHATLKALRDIPGGGLRAMLTVSFEVEGQKRPAAFGDAALVYYREQP
ncbi:MAG: MaoC family dehydratase [Myxococcota bacterium]